MRLPVLLGLTGLIGCGGVSEDEFRERYAERTCDFFFECVGESTSEFMFFDSPEECAMLFAFAWAQVPDECDYDRKAAADCLDAIDAASCDDEEGEGMDACFEVYTGDDGCSALFAGSSTGTWTTTWTSTTP